MKKIKLFTLALAALFAGSAMAETEKNPAEASTSAAISGVSYTIGGDYIAGKGGAKAGTMTSRGIKFRINRSYGKIENAVPFVVNEGYKITGISFDGQINDNAKTSVLGKILVDGMDIAFTSVTLPSKSGSIQFTTGTIEAKKDVVFVFDGNASQANVEYTVTYEVAQVAVDDATLKSITVDGEALEGFDPAVETYNVELPFGTTAVPAVVATTTSKKATVVVTPATAIPGATTILVTAEDGTTTKTYTINFTAAQTASSEKELLNVTIDGKAVAISENAGSLLVSKNADVTALTINFEVSESATASIESGSTHDFTNPLSITVTAQDNSAATYTITVAKAEKDVLYLTTASVEGDKMYAVVAAKGFYIEARGEKNDNADFSGYDLVVLHESLEGRAAADGELNALATANVPVLNTKSYFYPEGRWGWGAASNGNNQQGVKINTTYSNIASHPLFAGLKDTITIYNTAKEKNIQPVVSFVEGKEGYVLANVPGGAAIHELPAAQRIGEEATAKYLLISLFDSQYADLTAEAETLLSNAIDYLLSADAWTPGPSTALDNAVVAEKAQKMIINGQLVIVKDGVRYNAQGVTINK